MSHLFLTIIDKVNHYLKKCIHLMWVHPLPIVEDDPQCNRDKKPTSNHVSQNIHECRSHLLISLILMSHIHLIGDVLMSQYHTVLQIGPSKYGMEDFSFHNIVIGYIVESTFKISSTDVL